MYALKIENFALKIENCTENEKLKIAPALKIENFANKTACGEAHHCDNTIQLQ
jgi:hypothetical protein